MKRNIFMIVFFVSVVLYAVPFTTQGMIKVPDAYVMPHKMAEISAITYRAANESESYGTDFAGVLNVGIYNWLEFGFVGTANEFYYMNIKGRLIQETETLPAISLGIENLGTGVKVDQVGDFENTNNVTDLDDYRRNSIYFVMSKYSLLRGLPFIPYLETNIHLGFGTGRFKGNLELSKQTGGLFGGFEFKPSQYYSILAEMDGYNINAGLSGKYKNISACLGLYRLEELDRRDLKYAFSVKYIFDVFSDKKAYEENIQYAKKNQMPVGKKVISKKGEILTDNPLKDELDAMIARRKQAEKDLEEIKKILREE